MAGSGRRRPGDGGRYVVVVESPAKAKTLSNCLGTGHRVIATRGHVSDLPAKAGFLEGAFGRWVDYGFTAAMEADLDRIAAGGLAWRGMLEGFWAGFQCP